MSKPKDSRGSNRYRGNERMIAKVLDCVDATGAAYVQHQREEFRDNIVNGRDRRSAAQAKRERKMAKRARLYPPKAAAVRKQLDAMNHWFNDSNQETMMNAEQAPNISQAAIAKPSPGRIVLVTDADSNGVSEHPAIVTRVWSPECVNLTVFPDYAPPYYMTSVQVSTDGSSQPQRWRWPPRV